MYRLLEYSVAVFPLSKTTVLIFVTPVWFMFAIKPNHNGDCNKMLVARAFL